jgi:hypothetical protein
VDNPTVAYNVKLQTPVTEVLRGKLEAATVNEATFALVTPAGMVMVLELKLGLKLVRRVPVNVEPE